jgi:uncharacterized protein (DUF305 family)
MHIQTRQLSRVCAITVLALSAGFASAQGTAGQKAPMGHGSEAMHEQMMGGMQKMQSMQISGDTDKDFAMMMRMHHQQAVDMAKAEIEHGKSAELKAMARKIIADQQKEIAQLEKWLGANK